MTTSEIGSLVMIMEDDIARLIAHHLEFSDFRIHRSGRPFDLITDAEKEEPVLFILDLMLPERDGFQICRKIRARPRLRDVPIFILTARTSEENRKRAMETGADAYLTKPFSPPGLIGTVRKLSKQNHP
jgi:DNA-binding response OmpR family regulator